MNQKSRNALYAGLGTVFAVMLANPAIAYAGTWSNEGGPNRTLISKIVKELIGWQPKAA